MENEVTSCQPGPLPSMPNKGIIVPTMGNSKRTDISFILFGKTRHAVLTLLYGHSDEAFYLNQILRTAGTGSGAGQRELRQLCESGIVRRFSRGKQVYYQANPECSIFAELKGILAASRSSKNSRVASNNILVPGKKVADFCQRNHIRTLSLFGSVLKRDFRPDSDIDVLVEFEPGYVPGFFRLFDLENKLSSIFGGRKVDLRTSKDLSRYFRDAVIATAETYYAQ